jgi:hypothetical protein
VNGIVAAAWRSPACGSSWRRRRAWHETKGRSSDGPSSLSPGRAAPSLGRHSGGLLVGGDPFSWRGIEQSRRRHTRPRLLLAAIGMAARLPDARIGGHPWLLTILLLLLSGGGKRQSSSGAPGRGRQRHACWLSRSATSLPSPLPLLSLVAARQGGETEQRRCGLPIGTAWSRAGGSACSSSFPTSPWRWAHALQCAGRHPPAAPHLPGLPFLLLCCCGGRNWGRNPLAAAGRERARDGLAFIQAI